MSKLQFETPENVAVQFALAGLGTRYVAWFVDQILTIALTIFIVFLLACTGASFQAVEDLFETAEAGSPEATMFIVGFIMLIMGLGSFVYFGFCELLLRGQTPGKRMSGIRVVKVNGFALDATSILIRNVFRVLDHIPVLWLVPLLSARGQRAGDMVAGTVVVRDENVEVSAVRTQLTERSPLESEFRFDATALGKLSEQDVKAVQTLLERWNNVPDAQRNHFSSQIINSLTQKLNIERPPAGRELRFFEDLLAAELRRQHRGLG